MLAMFVALAISVLVLLLTQCDVGKTQTRTQEDCEGQSDIALISLLL